MYFTDCLSGSSCCQSACPHTSSSLNLFWRLGTKESDSSHKRNAVMLEQVCFCVFSGVFVWALSTSRGRVKYLFLHNHLYYLLLFPVTVQNLDKSIRIGDITVFCLGLTKTCVAIYFPLRSQGSLEEGMESGGDLSWFQASADRSL